jgi:hypothetical protein
MYRGIRDIHPLAMLAGLPWGYSVNAEYSFPPEEVGDTNNRHQRSYNPVKLVLFVECRTRKMTFRPDVVKRSPAGTRAKIGTWPYDFGALD